MVYDLIIVGAGPAGLSAAIYAARYRLNAIVIGKEIGGMAGYAHKVCNYPSYSEINGIELMQKFVKHVKELGVQIINEEVLKISGKDGNFVVKTGKKEYAGKKIIYAGGTIRNKLGARNEEKFIGKGVSYCTTCDAGFFKERIVAVVGGGDAALSSALLLSKFAKKIIIIYRKSEFKKANPLWIEQVEKNKKISCECDEEVSEILGNEAVTGVKLKSGRELKADGVFVEIGSIPHTYVLSSLGVKKSEKGYIVTDKNGRTSVKGLFAAGDITNNNLKQIVTAAGEGASAAFEVFKELRKEKGRV